MRIIECWVPSHIPGPGHKPVIQLLVLRMLMKHKECDRTAEPVLQWSLQNSETPEMRITWVKTYTRMRFLVLITLKNGEKSKQEFRANVHNC